MKNTGTRGGGGDLTQNIYNSSQSYLTCATAIARTGTGLYHIFVTGFKAKLKVAKNIIFFIRFYSILALRRNYFESGREWLTTAAVTNSC